MYGSQAQGHTAHNASPILITKETKKETHLVMHGQISN